MSGCMSALGGMPQAELSKGLKQLKSEHPPLLGQLEGLYDLAQKIDQEIDVETNFAALITKAKEENVLFPMAERMLTEEEKEELYRKIQDIK
jgi:regulator of cell morphogenesis and NO signaling